MDYRELSFIQDCISRMALDAWFFKVCAVVVFLAAVLSSQILLVIPILVFWGLDAYFLRLERMFRKLYDEAQKAPEHVMQHLNPHRFEGAVPSWFETVRSVTLVPFYLCMILVVCLV